ncbi:MAG TPA: ABC transporter ATP-binding protein [Candidatus Faecaligallichristensenella faecipullorum]|nr:ABC transporter ATP-binding protein [Candidatus Faecaligallichristensenella faecipullorum]
MAKLLEVKNLITQFKVDKTKIISAVDKVSFSIDEGETLAIVGESGSGKSVTALSVMQLVPNPPGHIEGGEIFFQGEDLLKMSPAQMREVRGNKISMIFQEPMTSLNPVYTIGEQITEAIRLHLKLSKKDAEARAVELLRKVEIPDAEKRLKTYPHQLSGGMRQRVMICMALSCSPKLLIADEPTTALDVTIQAQILDLIRHLRESEKTAVMFITHDLGVVADIAHRAVVMYAGNIMEMGSVHDMFLNPLHPYTRGLLNAIPKLSTPRGEKLYTIRGIVPDLSNLPKGCVFSTRCEECMEICHEKRPPLRQLEDGRQVRCFKVEGGKVIG